MSRPLLLPWLLLILAACGGETTEAWPERLSDWQLFAMQQNQLQLAPDTMAYSLATPLFSDHALKLRTLRLPAGTSATVAADGSITFPVGSVLSKTFYYAQDEATGVLLQGLDEPWGFEGTGLQLDDLQLIETRLLVHSPAGWQALPYVWDEAQQEAFLRVTGDLQRWQLKGTSGDEELIYIVPNQNECASCHAIDQANNRLQPLGPRIRHLNRDLAWQNGGNQLLHWQQRGIIDILPDKPAALPADPLWPKDPEASLDARARAWLDVNCGHCHQPGAAADTSALFLHAEASSALSLGICKPPVAAGRGTGGHRYSIVPGEPEASILLYRMQSSEPGVLMPELGRTQVQDEAVALISDWIRQLPGDCD